MKIIGTFRSPDALPAQVCDLKPGRVFQIEGEPALYVSAECGNTVRILCLATGRFESWTCTDGLIPVPPGSEFPVRV